MDLIVDDPDTNPAFRQWQFRLHGLDGNYLEIDGDAIYLTSAFLSSITSPGNPNTEAGVAIGVSKNIYVELVGLDEAFMFAMLWY